MPARSIERSFSVIDAIPESRLKKVLAAGVFTVTAEAVPPLSGDVSPLIGETSRLKGFADAVNVTDGAGACVQMAASAFLVREGIEPVLQLTCRDRNRLALQADLVGAWALGVRNILCLRGDNPTAGDQPNSRPIFDLDTQALLATATRMREEGQLPGPSNRDIHEAPRYFIGAADMPVDPESGWKPETLSRKIGACADFVQTQFCFDIGIMERYADCLRDEGITERLSVLIGLGPIPSAESARWMRDNLSGAKIPDALVDRLEGADDPRVEGRRICIELMQQMREIDGISGDHLMAPRQREEILGIIKDSGVLSGRDTSLG